MHRAAKDPTNNAVRQPRRPGPDQPRSHFRLLAVAVTTRSVLNFHRLCVKLLLTVGARHVAADPGIELAQALAGAWDDPGGAGGGNGSNAGHGVYDPSKWAVVFKYASVAVGQGATLRCANSKRNSRSRVTWTRKPAACPGAPGSWSRRSATAICAQGGRDADPALRWPGLRARGRVFHRSRSTVR